MAMRCEAPKGPRLGTTNYRSGKLKAVIGSRIRMRREALGIHQKDMAATLGVRPQCLRMAEHGVSMSLELLVDAALELDCTLDDLVPVDWEAQ